MKTPTLVNRHHKLPYDIYIGRGSIWGNPYPIDKSTGVTRTMSLAAFRTYLYESIENGSITIDDFKALSGKVLCCSCSPHPCHGDIIIEVFIAIMEIENDTEV